MCEAYLQELKLQSFNSNFNTFAKNINKIKKQDEAEKYH